MSDPRDSDGTSGDAPIPDDPSGEAREQLEENDELLREGDEPTPRETVPRHGVSRHRHVLDEEQREKRDEDEQAHHLMHDEDLPDPAIEP